MKYSTLFFAFFWALTGHCSPLENLIQTAWNKDSFLKAQDSKIEAAKLNRFAQFLPNNPTLTYMNQDNSSWRTYGVSLNVGIPGRAFALHKVDNEVLNSEKSELFAKRIELASFITDRYISCASTKELLSILNRAVKELAILKDAITARYEMGQSTQAERIGIELQYRQANIEYQTFKDQGKVACEKLEEVIADKNLGESIPDEPGIPEDFSEELLSKLGNKSMDVIRADNESRVAKSEADVAFWRAAPEFTFTYYRNYYNRVVASPIIPVQWTNTFLVSLNIPILFPFYERAEIMKAKAENEIIAQRAYMKKLESERLVGDAALSFQRSKKILKKLKEHDLPMAETMVDSTLAAYKQGKLGFSELILAKRTWLDLKKEEVNLKVNMMNSRLVCLGSCERKE